MATPQTVNLNPRDPLIFSVTNLQCNAAQKTSELLMENNRKFHIFFNQSGFHNHIVHHLLTIYALGASPSTIEKQYINNIHYQRSAMQVDETVVEQLHGEQTWKQCLGQEKHYNDFLTFFQREIGAKGWEQVLQEYLFGHDERADDLLVRTYNGEYHVRSECTIISSIQKVESS